MMVNDVEEIKWRMTSTHADLERYPGEDCEAGKREG
jgi:hypothetical protein